MHTLADQSTMPIWPVWVWALGVAILIGSWVLTIGLARAAAKPAPQHHTYQGSPYGPVARMCELRGHQYGLSTDGRYFVCVRGDDRVARVVNDLDDIERYANRGGAA